MQLIGDTAENKDSLLCVVAALYNTRRKGAAPTKFDRYWRSDLFLPGGRFGAMPTKSAVFQHQFLCHVDCLQGSFSTV